MVYSKILVLVLNIYYVIFRILYLFQSDVNQKRLHKIQERFSAFSTVLYALVHA